MLSHDLFFDNWVKSEVSCLTSEFNKHDQPQCQKAVH